MFIFFLVMGVVAIISVIGIVVAIVVSVTSESSFLGFAGEHWDLDTVPSNRGFASPHLVKGPVVRESVDPCLDLEDYACERDVAWLLQEHEKEMAEMRYVHYVILKANESIIAGDGDYPIHQEYRTCLSEDDERTPTECVEIAATRNPLGYCRLIKNGEGMYREHRSVFQQLLRGVTAEASKDYVEASGSNFEPVISNLCDAWKDDADAGPVALHLLSHMDRFRIKGRVVTPPSFSLFYTENPWDSRVAEYFWEFQLGHELAHEFVSEGAGKEMMCDERSAGWVFGKQKTLSDDQERGAALDALVSVSQMLCANGESNRVKALGELDVVKSVFEC